MENVSAALEQTCAKTAGFRADRRLYAWDERIELGERSGAASPVRQQLAGIIMWMPPCLVYMLLSGVLFGLRLRESDARDVRMERRTRSALTDLESKRRRMLVGDRLVSRAPDGGDKKGASAEANAPEGT